MDECVIDGSASSVRFVNLGLTRNPGKHWISAYAGMTALGMMNAAMHKPVEILRNNVYE